MLRLLIRRVLPLLTAMALIAACGGDDDTNGAEAPGSTEPGSTSTSEADGAEGEATSGGTVRVGWVNPTSTLDPHTPIHAGEPPFAWLVYDRLTMIDDDLEVQPMLAESWEFVDGGAALEMKLRDDVTFHDGSALTAEAAARSIQRAMEMDGSTVAATLTSVAGVEAVDELTLRIDLVPGRGAELPAVLAMSAGIVISLEALEDGRDLSMDPSGAGSGPYVLDEFEPNTSASFVPRPDGHWDQRAGLPDRLEITTIQANAARLNGILSGDLDVAQVSLPDVEEALSYVEDGELQGRLVEGFSQYSGFLNTSVAPFNDPKVRLAMNVAVDRDALADELFGGHCRATVQPFPSNTAIHNADIEDDYAFDLDRAASLLAESDHPNPSFQIGFIPGSAFEGLATVIQNWWSEAGIDGEILPIPSSELLAGFRSGDSHAVYNSIIANPHPALTISEFYLGGFNLVPEDAPERAELEALAARGVDPSVDEAERNAAYQEFWAISAEAAYYVPVCFINQVWLHTDDIVGIEITPVLWGGTPDVRYLAHAG